LFAMQESEWRFKVQGSMFKVLRGL
jgi:hypothetical protein